MPADRKALHAELLVRCKTDNFGEAEVDKIDMSEVERLAKKEEERINEMKQVEKQQRHFESTGKGTK